VGAIRLLTSLIPCCVVLMACGLTAGTAASLRPDGCIAPGQWAAPAAGGFAPRPAGQVLAELVRQQAVLLGETHEDPEHHRWQLHTIAALHALRPEMVLGFEMFPRRVQPILDEWVAGRLTDAEFLTRVEWPRVWGYDAQFYLPIFQFARMHRIPMLALNVERRLVGRVGDVGWAAVPAAEREGVTDPAPADREYAVRLHQSYLDHQPPGGRLPTERKQPSEVELADVEFRRFVEAMQVWDRAMAQGIAAPLQRDDPPLVVAIMGSGHLRQGHGVPRQLRDLDVTRVAVALPWDPSDACAELVPGVANVVFGVEARPQPARSDRPRLGISIDPAPTGVLVREVVVGSIAEQAGIRAGDVIVRIAGESAAQPGDVIEAVQRQASGTWLPITVKRGDETLDLVARFPPRK
jgi:hypothetical protein